MNAVIEEALEQMATCGPEFHGGLSNHGPMAADALIHLGRSEAVSPWVERYKRRLDVRPPTGVPIDSEHWQLALGVYSQWPAWQALFERELAAAPWDEVVRTWVPRLAPGFLAGATHGMLRTAHAVRGLCEGDSPAGRDELAQGLAYWAARYYAMPIAPSSEAPKGLDDALAAIPLVPEERRRNNGFITTAVLSVAAEEAFAPVANTLDVSGDVDVSLSAFTATFARIYLENARISPIAFVHSVTAPSAIRMLKPVVGDESARELLRYGWQAGAAFIAAYARPGEIRTWTEPEAIDWEDLADRAVASADEHAIKMSEACLREYRITPDPVFAAAAADVSQRLRIAR
jgi:hypothetical protein